MSECPALPLLSLSLVAPQSSAPSLVTQPGGKEADGALCPAILAHSGYCGLCVSGFLNTAPLWAGGLVGEAGCSPGNVGWTGAERGRPGSQLRSPRVLLGLQSSSPLAMFELHVCSGSQLRPQLRGCTSSSRALLRFTLGSGAFRVRAHCSCACPAPPAPPVLRDGPARPSPCSPGGRAVSLRGLPQGSWSHVASPQAWPCVLRSKTFLRVVNCLTCPPARCSQRTRPFVTCRLSGRPIDALTLTRIGPCLAPWRRWGRRF